jgi:heat shock protein HtpX
MIYLLGRWMFYPSFSRGYGNSRREGGNISAVIGGLSLVIYFILSLFTLNLSRLREYYADSHSATIVKSGTSKLSNGLVKIIYKTYGSKKRLSQNSVSFKSLFISDPGIQPNENTSISVQDYLNKEITRKEEFLELFSTHPNITKRLRALNNLNS